MSAEALPHTPVLDLIRDAKVWWIRLLYLLLRFAILVYQILCHQIKVNQKVKDMQPVVAVMSA